MLKRQIELWFFIKKKVFHACRYRKAVLNSGLSAVKHYYNVGTNGGCVIKKYKVTSQLRNVQ